MNVKFEINILYVILIVVGAAILFGGGTALFFRSGNANYKRKYRELTKLYTKEKETTERITTEIRKLSDVRKEFNQYRIESTKRIDNLEKTNKRLGKNNKLFREKNLEFKRTIEKTARDTETAAASLQRIITITQNRKD